MINRILISHHGLPALKFILSSKEYVDDNFFDNYTFIGFVTENDIKSGYKYLELLDECISAENDIYTDINGILNVCKENNIDAVWPGWGYLSENPNFAETLEENGIIFIGPSSKSIRELGDKIRSTELAEEANVPTMPWSGANPLENLDEVKYWCNKIGLPVMIKSADGGGGRGIRKVSFVEEIENMYYEVVKECPGPIFVMKLAVNCLHLEVQLIGDGENVMHLHGRDCSVQRRNQKLMEEGPVVAMPEEKTIEMAEAAIRLAKKVNYKSVGTAEFLYEPSTGNYYFLEINPRLQVEHIVTEMICDVNLPVAQIMIASGKKLEEIDMLTKVNQKKIPNKFVIAARINAENPYNNFQPCSGKIWTIETKNMKNCWSYFSVGSPSEILSNCDNQFGHIFAIGNNREEARKKLIELLQNTGIYGEIFNTGNFIKQVLKNEDYINHDHHTQWVSTLNLLPEDSSIKSKIAALCYSINKAVSHINKHINEINLLYKKGHQISRENLNLEYEIETILNNINYKFNIWINHNKNEVIFKINNKIYSSKVTESVSSLFIKLNKYIYKVRVSHESFSGTELTINNSKFWFPKYEDPSIIRSKFSGRIVKCMFKDNTSVTKGQKIMELEAMKMILSEISISDGVIKYEKRDGDLVYNGEIIARLEVDNINLSDIPSNYNKGYNIEEITTDKLMQFEKESYKDFYKEYSSFIEDEIEQNISKDFYEKNNTINPYLLPEMFNSIETQEIIYENNKLKFIKRESNKNNIGMVGWLLTVPLFYDNKTNKYTNNIKIVLISNDLKFKHGSFGYQEDIFFQKCSEYSRIYNLPRIYISCNSGARVSLCNDVKNMYKIKWKNNNIKESVEFLYLDKDDYESVNDKVNCELIEIDGYSYYKIKSIQSEGVKTLDGSALIASETAKAYNETFTLSYITGRTVGIGSYLVKLGERVIQKKDSPILLTGYKALNSVLGKNQYSSNLEIGGPNIMNFNGITDRVVSTDREGVNEIVEWLSYLKSSNIQPVLPELIIPQNSSYNVRNLIDSFFDQNSFYETMENWAKSVITGRARINGMPIGVIATNNTPSTQTIPVDPGNEESSRYEVNYSGSVWYPNSSLKTAQSIRDIKRERLPLLILANWRGFSGGTSDMFNDILRYGSEIVRELESYDKPIYVYVPPYSQLRGGALVVLSYSINKDNIKVLADPTSSLNILEPTGMASVKYKMKDILKTMTRHGIEDTPENRSIYSKIALDLIDLHDRPSSSNSDKIIHEEVKWINFRKYLENELNTFK